ncbi:MAG: DNA polymerase III subunit delta' [Anaerolineales bacterium]|nr:DNA polymerase III subunit delta' [Anaerolineales bacterium]
MIGHQWAINLLKVQVANNASRHAYLFTGPKGVGKRTMAIRFAQAINCDKSPSPGEPCFECRTCTLIERMQHPDLAIVQSEREGRTLKVGQVRELQHEVSLTPYEARYRVAILLRFEEASISAANALLKTLEEPPPQVKIVLTAESSERLLPTIVSRCEVLRLRPLAVNDISLGLSSKMKIPNEQSILLAHISGGRPGYALRLQNEPELLTKRNKWLDDLQHMIPSSRVERFTFAENLAKDKDALVEILQVWLSFWRDMLIISMDASIELTNQDREEEIKQLADDISVYQTRKFVSRLEQSYDLINHNVNIRLVTDVLLLDLPRT